MPTVAATSVAEKDFRDKPGVAQEVAAVLPTASAADSVTVTLPARWRGIGISIGPVRAEKWTTGDPATAAGARTRAVVPVTFVSVVEATGVVTLLLGATAVLSTETGRVYVTVSPAS